MEKDLWKKKLNEEKILLTTEFKTPFRKTDQTTPQEWSAYFDKKIELEVNKCNFQIYSTEPDIRTTDSVFVFLHGAGHSALSWALVSKLIKQGNIKCVAIDARGHGSSKCDSEENLSSEVLTSDVVDILNKYFENTNDRITLVGHSMGGAICARAAATGLINKLVGIVVIDVVEGTALAALPYMHQVLESRPSSFETLEDAIQWSISSGTLKNIESARISIPSQLIYKDDQYYWRTNLMLSEQYWKGWFTNLSTTFLSVKVPKLLLLAGTDRLDKDLTIAQMQGKFQLVVLPAVGHTLQEDDPQKTAQSLLQFQQRFRL